MAWLTSQLTRNPFKFFAGFRSTPSIYDNIDSFLFLFQLAKKSLLGSGKPGEAICKKAEECGADMIVIGSRGQNAVRRTFVGSVSDYVLHHAHIPITIVPGK